MTKVYWLDLTLAYIFSIMLSAAPLPQVQAEACIALQASWKQVNSSNCPNHVWRTKSSIKKWIKVHRTVRSMFGEQTFAQLRTGFSRSFFCQSLMSGWTWPSKLDAVFAGLTCVCSSAVTTQASTQWPCGQTWWATTSPILASTMWVASLV